MERQGPPFARETLNDQQDHWLLPGLEAAREGVAPDLGTAVEAALVQLTGWRSRRLEAMEALPTGLIHGRCGKMPGKIVWIRHSGRPQVVELVVPADVRQP
jgi:hypothetical protein